MPIDIRLTAVPAAGDGPLASHIRAADGDVDVAVPIHGAGTAGLDSYLVAPVADVTAASQVTDRAGDIAQVVARPGAGIGRVLFLGLGDGSPGEMRKAGAALARRMTPGRPVLSSAAYGRPDEAVHAFAEGLLLGSYRLSLASRAAPAGQPGEVRLLLPAADGQPGVLEKASIVGRAVALARDLANMPSGTKTPGWLAGEALRVAAVSGLTARVFEAAELAAHGFGGMLAVGSGSAQPPALIELGYEPPGWREHVVLVGKGITFDSGGLSLKPTDGMKLMKTDMAGGAAVIAAMSALARLGVGLRVTGLVAAAENISHESPPRPGSIEAALFLREFTGARPWAHLDIAGAARSAADEGEFAKGATGFGTRLLLRWLSSGTGMPAGGQPNGPGRPG